MQLDNLRSVGGAILIGGLTVVWAGRARDLGGVLLILCLGFLLACIREYVYRQPPDFSDAAERLALDRNKWEKASDAERIRASLEIAEKLANRGNRWNR